MAWGYTFQCGKEDDVGISSIVMTLFLPSVASLPVPICTGYSSQRKVVRLPNGEKNKLQMQHQMIKNWINHFSINIRKTHNKRE